MKRTLAYLTTFVAGFAACALILRLSQGVPLRPGGVPLPGGRQALAQALSSAPTAGAPSHNALPSIADAAERVAAAVVNIEVEGRRPARGNGMFGGLMRGEEAFEGSGSGIILSPDGYVLTNNHVIAPGGNPSEMGITATLANGKRYAVSVVGRDPLTDLAVIKLMGGKNLTAALLGDSDKLRVGDWTIAVGNPLGFSSTVTMGIISALNRDYLRKDSVALDRVIQTDAAINPGNSGGALADVDGRVIGINTAIASNSGTSVGIGFAIPINTARRIASDLIARGKVARPYLGVSYAPLDEVNHAALPSGLVLPPDNQGMLVQPGYNGGGITPNSPAQKAGLREWDILRAVDGKPLQVDRELKEAIVRHKVGEPLHLTIWRDGREQQVEAVLEEMPEDFGK